MHYEMVEKTEAISYGGIGAIHKMKCKLGLAEELDRELHLLKKHLSGFSNWRSPDGKPLDLFREGVGEVRFL